MLQPVRLRLKREWLEQPLSKQPESLPDSLVVVLPLLEVVVVV